MSAHATGSFEFTSWDEKPYNEIDGGPKLTRASVTNSFHGDIAGETALEYLMIYLHDDSGSFIGLERVVGHVGDRSGSFVLQHSGTFGGGTVKAALVEVRVAGRHAWLPALNSQCCARRRRRISRARPRRPTGPYPGGAWRPRGQPACPPHESRRNGTAKRLTLSPPASGQVRVKGVTSCTNQVPHPWLRRELSRILVALPAPAGPLSPAETHAAWTAWQERQTVRIPLPAERPPRRLLVLALIAPSASRQPSPNNGDAHRK